MMRVVTISVNRQPTKAVCCPGTDAIRCGAPLTRPGACPNRHCRRVLTQAEYDVAVGAAERSEAA